MTTTFFHKYGTIMTFAGRNGGFSWRIPDDWTIAQVQRYIAELLEFVNI